MPWEKNASLSLDDVIPDAVRPLLSQAREKQLVVSAEPLVFDGLYCGYSLFVHTPLTIDDSKTGSSMAVTVKNRVDVTAAAAFVFPYALAPAADRARIRALVEGIASYHRQRGGR